MHSRRALLYMPGDDRRKIEKATTLGVDCICMDLEAVFQLGMCSPRFYLYSASHHVKRNFSKGKDIPFNRISPKSMVRRTLG